MDGLSPDLLDELCHDAGPPIAYAYQTSQRQAETQKANAVAASRGTTRLHTFNLIEGRGGRLAKDSLYQPRLGKFCSEGATRQAANPPPSSMPRDAPLRERLIAATLRRLYETEMLQLSMIALPHGTSTTNVTKLMDAYGIPRQSSGVRSWK